MPDAVLIALIAAGGGLVSGLVVAVIGPFFGDKIAKGTEDRADRRAERQRRLQQITQLGAQLAKVSPSGDRTTTDEANYRDLRTAAFAIGDDALISHIGRMHSSDRGSRPWQDAYGDACARAGELQRADPRD